MNGEKVAEGRIDGTQCCIFSADEGADVGVSTGTALSDEYAVPSKFTGAIERVTIELKGTEEERSGSSQAHSEGRAKRALSRE